MYQPGCHQLWFVNFVFLPVDTIVVCVLVSTGIQRVPVSVHYLFCAFNNYLRTGHNDSFSLCDKSYVLANLWSTVFCCCSSVLWFVLRYEWILNLVRFQFLKRLRLRTSLDFLTQHSSVSMKINVKTISLTHKL